MVSPIDYTSAFANVPSPVDAFANSFKLGAGIRQVQQQQQAQDDARLREQQKQEAIQALLTNPRANARDYAGITMQFPELRESFKQAWDIQSTDQKANSLQLASQAYAASSIGRNDIAEKLFRDQATAMRNSGAPEEEAASMDMWADMIQQAPDQARHIGGLILASEDPEKFAETFGKLGAEQRAQDEAPANLRTANANATAAEVKAKYAESEALLDLEKAGWDIKKIQSDMQIDKENSRIAAMNAALNRESNDMKRTELRMKIDDAVRERDTKIREKTANIESARSTLDSMMNTVDRIIANPALNDVLGSFEGRVPGAVGSAFDDDESDAIALIDNLKSQAFLSQVQKMKEGGATGLGSLTEKEGAKLETALQNLDRAQGEKQFRANLAEIQRLTLKARKNLADRYGVPDSVPDRPAAAVPGLPAGFKILGKE